MSELCPVLGRLVLAQNPAAGPGSSEARWPGRVASRGDRPWSWWTDRSMCRQSTTTTAPALGSAAAAAHLLAQADEERGGDGHEYRDRSLEHRHAGDLEQVDRVVFELMCGLAGGRRVRRGGTGLGGTGLGGGGAGDGCGGTGSRFRGVGRGWCGTGRSGGGRSSGGRSAGRGGLAEGEAEIGQLRLDVDDGRGADAVDGQQLVLGPGCSL